MVFHTILLVSILSQGLTNIFRARVRWYVAYSALKTYPPSISIHHKFFNHWPLKSRLTQTMSFQMLIRGTCHELVPSGWYVGNMLLQYFKVIDHLKFRIWIIFVYVFKYKTHCNRLSSQRDVNLFLHGKRNLKILEPYSDSKFICFILKTVIKYRCVVKHAQQSYYYQ